MSQDHYPDEPAPLVLVSQDHRASGVAPHITKEPTEPKEPKKKKAAAEDPRRAPFIAFVFETRPDLVVGSSDFKELKDLLERTRDKASYTTEKLQEYWNRFLNSPDPFHRRQGKPLRYFCANINAFTGNGNGTHSGNGQQHQTTAFNGNGRKLVKGYIPKQ